MKDTEKLKEEIRKMYRQLDPKEQEEVLGQIVSMLLKNSAAEEYQE